MLIRIFFTIILALYSFNAFAEGSCTAPEDPACASNEDTFKSKEAYSACAEQFKILSAQTKEYISCKKAELQDMAESVQKEVDDLADSLNNKIKEFNCRAKPNGCE